MRWIPRKEEKNIFGITITTVKCSNCGSEETIHPGQPLPIRCYVCDEELEEDDRLTKEQLENVWDSGYTRNDIEEWEDE